MPSTLAEQSSKRVMQATQLQLISFVFGYLGNLNYFTDTWLGKQICKCLLFHCQLTENEAPSFYKEECINIGF
jgi:hypothetical protein